jgi:hypothetical protein
MPPIGRPEMMPVISIIHPISSFPFFRNDGSERAAFSLAVTAAAPDHPRERRARLGVSWPAMPETHDVDQRPTAQVYAAPRRAAA